MSDVEASAMSAQRIVGYAARCVRLHCRTGGSGSDGRVHRQAAACAGGDETLRCVYRTQARAPLRPGVGVGQQRPSEGSGRVDRGGDLEHDAASSTSALLSSARISFWRLQQHGATAARAELHALEAGIEPAPTAGATNLIDHFHLAAHHVAFPYLDALGGALDGDSESGAIGRLGQLGNVTAIDIHGRCEATAQPIHPAPQRARCGSVEETAAAERRRVLADIFCACHGRPECGAARVPLFPVCCSRSVLRTADRGGEFDLTCRDRAAPAGHVGAGFSSGLLGQVLHGGNHE